MKTTRSFFITLLICFTLLFGSTLNTFAEDSYIAVHNETELNALFEEVKDYLSDNKKAIEKSLDEDEQELVSSAFVRAWGIEEYEDATPEQIDHAYDALYNMYLFLGFVLQPYETFEDTETLFLAASQLLDQEYYDLLSASGEKAEVIENAETLRDLAEELYESPDEFSAEEVEEAIGEIYQETYLAAGLKALAHTEALPSPEELFPENSDADAALVANPMTEYETAEPLNQLLGIEMPLLAEEFGCETAYYSIIADVVAETQLNCKDDATVLLRLSREADTDISGVYGADFYEDWEWAKTAIEVDKYGKIWIAKGVVLTADEQPYSFAVDAEGMDEAQFRKITETFIESCRNQRTAR